MKKQPDVTARTKKAFVDAFCELYIQKPIEKISVQEIANKAGYNRSSFYQHFCDIYELLDCLENDVLNSMGNKFAESGGIHEALSVTGDKALYLNALFGDYGSSHFMQRLKSSVPFEAHRLDISKDDPIAPYLMEFHLSTVLSMYRLWYSRGKDISPDEVANLALNLYMGGISSTLASL